MNKAANEGRDTRAGRARRAAPRLIRSDRIPYPDIAGFDGEAEYEPRRSSGRKLQPVRDTGLKLEARAMRTRRRKAKARRTRSIAVLALLGIAVVLALAASRWSTGASKDSPAEKTGPKSTSVAVADPFVDPEPEPDPTPYFASFGGLKLRIPVGVDALTELGFHQASYSYAEHLKSLLPAADMTAAKNNRGTGRDLEAQEFGDDAVLTGAALLMWRGANDTPDSAVDVGAAPGTPVVAPLSGTVVLVKPYKLYEKWDDVRIHIQPEGRPDLDLVMIHVQNPTVQAGDEVVAGVTQVGEVRKLSDKVTLQLRTYVKDEGNHVHIQLNNATDPSYKGLDGAIKVGASD